MRGRKGGVEELHKRYKVGDTTGCKGEAVEEARREQGRREGAGGRGTGRDTHKISIMV